MKLYIEDEGCVWGDSLTGTTLAVSEVVRDEEAVLRTLLHELQSLGPSCDDLVETECSTLATTVAAVEYLTVDERSLIIALYNIGSCRLLAVAFTQNLILQS